MINLLAVTVMLFSRHHFRTVVCAFMFRFFVEKVKYPRKSCRQLQDVFDSQHGCSSLDTSVVCTAETSDIVDSRLSCHVLPNTGVFPPRFSVIILDKERRASGLSLGGVDTDQLLNSTRISGSFRGVG
ncbi:hypothetical protein C8Q75DRAFT_479525 [Abortiporus biennis]|nr:hypothetical protein C8Q75DRAFT_479525 [Abortiporus biennis]